MGIFVASRISVPLCILIRCQLDAAPRAGDNRHYPKLSCDLDEIENVIDDLGC